MPEYGRNVQKMIDHVKTIEDREKRSEQAKAVVQVMGTLNPQMRELVDFKHKLWDHAHVISGYELDIDAPYPAPAPSQFEEKPDRIPLETRPIKAACYGRNIENMIGLIAQREDDEVKSEMIRMLAHYMRQQYLIWNKDNVSEETIFADIEKLSEGKLKVPQDVHLSALSQNAVFNRPGAAQLAAGSQPGKGKNYKNGKNRSRKRQQ